MLTGFALGCIVPLLVITYRDFRHLLVGKVFILALISAAAFVADPLIFPSWRWLTSNLQTAMPGLFWLLCQLVFARKPRLATIWGGMALYSFVAPALARPFVPQGGDLDVLEFFGWRLGQYFEYAVVLHGLVHVVSHWRNDLVEARRKARLGFLLILGGAVGVGTISLNFELYGDYTRSFITAFAGFFTLVFLLRGTEGILIVTGTNSGIPAVLTRIDSAALSANDQSIEPDQNVDKLGLKAIMEAGFYRTEKLTLKRLSEETGIPEYRLRRVINQTLGYRNFNDYINQLRIADAARRLEADPDEPVLNVSLDVGYRTLSSFNRAFREIMATTPTQYREDRAEGRAPGLS